MAYEKINYEKVIEISNILKSTLNEMEILINSRLSDEITNLSGYYKSPNAYNYITGLIEVQNKLATFPVEFGKFVDNQIVGRASAMQSGEMANLK